MKNISDTHHQETLRLFHKYIQLNGFGSPREPLTLSISPNVFKQCYYKKNQLMLFCQQHGISTAGSKHDLTRRIDYFLRTGNIKSDSKKPNQGKVIVNKQYCLIHQWFIIEGRENKGIFKNHILNLLD